MAAKLSHPNAVAVLDVVDHHGETFLVTEYEPSRSLGQRLDDNGPLPPAHMARIGEQVASALAAAHRSGVVHGSISPSSVLITSSGVAKLTGFGASSPRSAAYAAPELTSGVPTPASDVFALGATLLHAVEGPEPYDDAGTLRPARHAGPAASVLTDMLRSEPAQRVSLRQATERLRAIAAGGGVAEAGTGASGVSGASAAAASAAGWTAARGALPSSGGGFDDRGPAARMAVPVEPATDHREPDDRRQVNVWPEPSPERHRKLGMAAGIVGFLVVLALLTAWLFHDDGPEPLASAPASTTPPPTMTTEPPTTTTTTTAKPSPKKTTTAKKAHHKPKPKKHPKTFKTKSHPQIGWSSAGQLVIDFYSNAHAGWSKLTPAAKRRFGSKKAFRKYFGHHGVTYAHDARAKSNADGSVTITTSVVSGHGGGRKHVRVVRGSNGHLFIASDPR